MSTAIDNDVLIIGAGMSGMGFAIQLIRQYGNRNFEIIEKTDAVGGTWAINTYPGCGCDVPSHFYSYSFAMNPNWSRKYSLQPEIQRYFSDVARKYNIAPHVQLGKEVTKAVWDQAGGVWVVTISDLNAKQTYQRRVKVLISAVGSLSTPKKCDIAGSDTFKGRLFHSAAWDSSFDYAGKEVIAIGNGCSATQFVPTMSQGPGKVKKITQFSRQAHWLSERPNPEYSSAFRWTMKWIPGAMRAYRGFLYITSEIGFVGFHKETGAKHRKDWTNTAVDYIKKNAPARYHDALVPRSEIGCKRRVMDTDYLECLSRDNVELVHNDPIAMITESGVRTISGRTIHADAIVLANGFETQKPLWPMEIIGKEGISVSDHWNKLSDGSPQAYLGTCLSGFPNLFIMMGPNTLSGHLSVIYTSECQIGLTLRLIKPVLKSLHPPVLSRLLSYKYPDCVAPTQEAEVRYNSWVQTKASQLVWAAGCTSWFIDEKTGRNTIMFPDYQFKFWLRSIFVKWSDFELKSSNGSINNTSAYLRSAVLLAWFGGVAFAMYSSLVEKNVG